MTTRTSFGHPSVPAAASEPGRSLCPGRCGAAEHFRSICANSGHHPVEQTFPLTRAGLYNFQRNERTIPGGFRPVEVTLVLPFVLHDGNTPGLSG
jgi:hypothetical protein